MLLIVIADLIRNLELNNNWIPVLAHGYNETGDVLPTDLVVRYK